MCSIVEFSLGDFEKITLRTFEMTCVPALRITDALCPGRSLSALTCCYPRTCNCEPSSRMIVVSKVILGPDVEFATIDHEDVKR